MSNSLKSSNLSASREDIVNQIEAVKDDQSEISLTVEPITRPQTARCPTAEYRTRGVSAKLGIATDRSQLKSQGIAAMRID